MIDQILKAWTSHPQKRKDWYDTVNTAGFQEVLAIARLAAIESFANQLTMEGKSGQDFLVAQSARMSFIEGFNQGLIFLEKIAKDTNQAEQPLGVDDYDDPEWIAKWNSQTK